MNAVLIGVAAGILTVSMLGLFKKLDSRLMYGLILTGIGYLYVGYTWTDTRALIVCSLQAILFSFLAYFGVRKSLLLLAVGYFAHGLWDLLFDLFPYSGPFPPHYDLFCLSIDFVMGFYLVLLHYKNRKTTQVFS